VTEDEFLSEVDERAVIESGTKCEQPRAAPRHTRAPLHPAELAPSPGAIKTAYTKALEEIHQKRGTTLVRDGYVSEVRDKAFWAFYGALVNACVAIVCDEHPASDYAKENRRPQGAYPMQVLASAPGSGKSTLAKAFATALTRVNESKPYPLGSVFLVHHIATAEAVFRELSALLPDTVAVFTTKHDAASGQTTTYSVTFNVSDLEKYPVIVVTHEFYMGIRGDHARYYTKGDLTFPRVVTFIDERVNEIAVHDLDPWSIEGVLKHVQQDTYAPRELLDSLLALVQFTHSKRFGDLDIETSAHNREQWETATAAIGFLRSEDAARYWRSASAQNPRVDFDAVFGFATAMADDQAFISRHNKGKNSVNFVGYDRALPRLPGMVLLDATADIDGVSKVCPWRERAKTPPEHYDRLEIIHVPSVAKGNIRRWLREPGHLQAYVGHVHDLIVRYVAAGQKALVVCTKDVVRAEKIDGWSEHMGPFLGRTTPNGNTADTEFTEGFAWSLDGRQIVLTWFGGYGIGANVWREADVVIICDDFHLPQRTIKATLQGLRGHKATEGFLGDPKSTWSDELEHLRDGHILRWMKQMALRGRAREMDGEGVCGSQGLVVTGDLVRLLAHRPKVFPGAKIKSEQRLDQGGHWLEKLTALLLSHEQHHEVSTTVIGEKLGVEWGDISGNLKKHKSYDAVLESIGWSYHRGSGSRAGCFRRIERTEPVGFNPHRH
jgi:hypothetical protein